MSQEALARELNVSRQTISRWELGEVAPDTVNVLALSKLMGVSTDYLLRDDCLEEIAAGNLPAETAPLGTGEVGALYRRTSLSTDNVNKNQRTAVSALSGIPAKAKEEERRGIVRENSYFSICVNQFYITLKQARGTLLRPLRHMKSVIALHLLEYLGISM